MPQGFLEQENGDNRGRHPSLSVCSVNSCSNLICGLGSHQELCGPFRAGPHLLPGTVGFTHGYSCCSIPGKAGTNDADGKAPVTLRACLKNQFWVARATCPSRRATSQLCSARDWAGEVATVGSGVTSDSEVALRVAGVLRSGGFSQSSAPKIH